MGDSNVHVHSSSATRPSTRSRPLAHIACCAWVACFPLGESLLACQDSKLSLDSMIHPALSTPQGHFVTHLSTTHCEFLASAVTALDLSVSVSSSSWQQQCKLWVRWFFQSSSTFFLTSHKSKTQDCPYNNLYIL